MDNFNPANTTIKKLKCCTQGREKATQSTLLAEVTAISSKANKKLISPIHVLYRDKPEAYDEAKRYNVPVYLPSIDFEGNPTHIGCLDIDRKKNIGADLAEAKKIISSLPWVMVCAYSLSGDGIFILFRYAEGKDHKQAIRAGIDELDFWGYTCDDLADLVRLRVQSYDPEPYINWGAELFDFEEVEQVRPTKKISSLNTDPDSDDFDLSRLCARDTPDHAFNNGGHEGAEVITSILAEQLGWDIQDGSDKEAYICTRPGGSKRSLIILSNEDVFKVSVLSSNTEIKGVEAGEVYNMYDFYKLLTGFDNFTALKTLSELGFGTFNESTKNDFPIEVFPTLFRDYAKDLKDSLNFPIDYTATAMLTAIATAVGTSVKLSVKAGWVEHASLFTCVVGDAGANKTHPLSTAFTPIRAIDKQRHTDYVERFEDFQRYEKLSKKDKEGEEQIICPRLEKSVLSNFTPEVLNKRLDENERGCAVLSDELATFFESMNNYSKGDQIGVYLSFWSNQPTTIDRISNPIPLFISRPYLSIIGGLQPRTLSAAFPANKLNNGFFQRFLFAYPDSAPKAPINDNVADYELAKAYERYINECYVQLTDRELTFTPEAKQFFYDWQADNCDKVNQHQNSIKGEILSKFDNHFLRLSLLLQMMHDVDSEEIEIKAVEGANLLCDYYLNCAFKVLAKIRDTENYLFSLPTEKQTLFSSLAYSFTTAEAVEVGHEIGLNEKAVKRLLNNAQLFKKVKHGNYSKVKSD